MKFLDLFAGIGGFRLGMEQAGHECVGYVEFDKYARKSYEAMHSVEGEWTAHDITRVTDDDIRELGDRGRIDCICGGFPCQSFSIAGKRGGFDDTRGTLFFEIVRFADILRPQYLFLENVKGLINHDGGITFETILRALDELGYDAEWNLCNSKDFGVPQNRERVFVIGHLRNGRGRKVFPVGGNNQAADIDVIGTTKKRHEPKISIRENTKKGYVEALAWDGIRLDHPNGTTGRGRVQKQLSPTLTTSGSVGVITDEKERNTFEVLFELQKQIGEKEIAKWRSRILDSFQQEEILRQDVYEKGLDIEQDEKKLERNQQSHECEVKNTTFDKQERMREMSINKEFRCSSHGRGSIQQFARELTSIMQKLSHETSQEKNLYRLRETTQGFGLLQQALYKIQEVWGSSLHKKQGVRIRKLTEKECWRLQSFTDEQFYKAKDSGVSNTQLYKQSGNSVTVNVIHEIAKKLEV